jgi:CubicO group peptidase (beta-lactamase class C family)
MIRKSTQVAGGWRAAAVVITALLLPGSLSSCSAPAGTTPAPAGTVAPASATSAPAGTKSASADTKEAGAIDDFVRAEMARQKVPGVAIAVVRGGEVVRLQGYGYANVELNVPVTADTIFQSGSMGKQFTAAAVMLLVQDGKLNLDDPIAKYFPGTPAAFRAITVRHLLTHTSGIPNYTNGALDYRRDYTEDDLLKMAFAMKLEFVPGSRWSYSNTGYAMLGFLIHKVSGRFYGDVLHDRVFVPAGMKTTRIISEEDIVLNRAAGYRLVKGELKNQEWVAPTLNTTADGSLYYSITDLVAWDRALRAGAVLQPASWAQVLTPVKLNSGRTYPYGFGWALKPINGHEVNRHGGSWQGFKTDILRYPKDGLTVVALCNLGDANPETFTDGIVGVVRPELARPKPEPIPDQEPAVAARVKQLLDAAARGTLSRAEFAAYMRARFVTETLPRDKDLPENAGNPRSVILFQREELGDDRVYQYEVVYAAKTFRVVLGLAPDGKISQFSIAPK